MTIPTPTPDSSPTSALSFRALQRLSAAVQPAPSGEPQTVACTDTTPAPRVKRPTRYEEQQAREREQWREIKSLVLEGVRRLREQEEGGFLQSPDLSRAALFAIPASRDVPELPLGKRPHDDDRSDDAEVYRRQERERLRVLLLRADKQAARGLRPNNCWRKLGSVGERGGVRPGMTAWPNAWTGYLLRYDADAQAAGSGDGWGSTLGIALKRIERELRETPLWVALWAYTEPRGGDITRVEEALSRGRTRRISRRQAYRWLEAAARRVSAEMTVIQVGRGRARDEQRAAERAEAEAWANE